ncbi:hypothetical protein LOTGIDRAFT_194783 [Lottia gigantea]|uniref:Plasminogen receptor (KT) n=1 Tax=Lottia gigantea TaxID=225164 RepID=V4BDI0_LOTGI|nr:hypothetical protein LOTGIDRAFT_194783 [Lottia gigantea]ESO86634.1 hypothetical protein LOTGIDRAFT_194783 [Lottia gigantea]
MGMFISKAMDENMKKQQEFMMQNQIVMLERQIQMQNQMRERQMAMQIARSRDMILWYGSFYVFAALGSIAGYRKKGNPAFIAPLIPLTLLLAYQYDMAHGSKMIRIRAEADRVLDLESEVIEMPHGLPTFSQIEAGRLKQKTEERLGQSHDIFL